MKNVYAFICATFFVACGKSDVKSPEPVFDDELAQRYYDYKELVVSQEDSHGFIYTDQCDSLLFTSLTHIGDEIEIRAAREANGRWQRRPRDIEACYPAHSASTISRDMLLGVLWYAWYHQDLELAENLWSYGAARSWIMGDGDRARTIFTPGLVSTLAQLIYKLGGKDHLERQIQWLEVPNQTDYEAHLQVLHILLKLRIYGTIEGTDEDRLKEQAAREPQNPLFQYAVGDVSSAIDLLKQDFPAHRLPTSSDHCARWLFQRDAGPDWEPCSDGETHSGGELLFLGHLILNG